MTVTLVSRGTYDTGVVTLSGTGIFTMGDVAAGTAAVAIHQCVWLT